MPLPEGTWGDASRGGDSKSVQAELTAVGTIYSTGWSFASKLTNGHVVTWGYAGSGGDSSSVQAELTAVDTIYSTGGAFAAKLTNGCSLW